MLEKTLFSVGSHKFYARYLLIIAVLAISFTVSALIRAQPAEYGFALNEYDPFFNYRATEFLLENGLQEYDDWHDTQSWYPTGRDVSKTSQFMQHGTAAALYTAFGAGSDLEDFLIMLPLVLGALTGIVMFALVRVIAGTSAGLFASLIFAVSLPILIRGPIGWFKAEPIGLFYGTIGIYLFLSAITGTRRKESLIKLAGAGIVMSMALSAWGGTQFFIIPLGLFFMTLPFVRRDHSFLIWAIPVFVGVLLASTMAYERPGASFVFGIGGAALGLSAGIMVTCILIWRKSAEGRGARNSILVVITAVAIATAILAVNSQVDYLDLPSFRYLNAINPFLTTLDPLVDSVSEHASLTPQQSFYFLSILAVFSGIGAWLLLSRRDKLDSYPIPLRTDMVVYAIIMGFAGVYISSAFTRLAVFSSISMMVLASIAIVILATLVFTHKRSGIGIKAGFIGAIVVMLVIPITVPAEGNWIETVKTPAVLYSGGASYDISKDDWPQALEWIRTQTPEDSIIFSWWDYGYWLETISDRTTLTNNLTIDSDRIEEVAQIFFSTPDSAWSEMTAIGVDYVLVYVVAQNISATADPFYILSGGGDESKKIWIARISGINVGDYLYNDGESPRPKFHDTMLGTLTPFEHTTYVNVATGLQSVKWQPGFVAVYEKQVKMTADSDAPFRLAYSSPSFDMTSDDIISGVFVYEINYDYVPESSGEESPAFETVPFMNDSDAVTSVPIEITPSDSLNGTN